MDIRTNCATLDIWYTESLSLLNWYWHITKRSTVTKRADSIRNENRDSTDINRNEIVSHINITLEIQQAHRPLKKMTKNRGFLVLATIVVFIIVSVEINKNEVKNWTCACICLALRRSAMNSISVRRFAWLKEIMLITSQAYPFLFNFTNFLVF